MTGPRTTPPSTCRGSRWRHGHPVILLVKVHIPFIVKVLVNNPCPQVKKENAFEDTMFLIELLKQEKQKENKQKKVSKNL